MKKEQLTEMLNRHQIWLDTQAGEGKRADLTGIEPFRF